MNKAQLIDKLSAQLGSKKAATDAVDAVIDTITRAVAKGERVAITGFGVFEKVARAARTGRNPRTGAAVKIKKTSVPKFKAGQSFKDVVSGAKKLPKVARHGSRARPPAPAAPAKKTAAKKTRQEGPGQEGRRQEDDGEEGSGQEGAGEEDRRQEGARAQALTPATRQADGPVAPAWVAGPSRQAGTRVRGGQGGHGEEGDPADAGSLLVAVTSMRTRWPTRSSRTPTGVEGRRVVGQLDAVVEQHRARPGDRVEAAHRCLHASDLPTACERCRAAAARSRRTDAQAPALRRGRPAVSTSRRTDGSVVRGHLDGAAGEVPVRRPGPNAGRRSSTGRASSSVVPLPSRVADERRAVRPAAAEQRRRSSSGRRAGRSADDAPTAVPGCGRRQRQRRGASAGFRPASGSSPVTTAPSAVSARGRLGFVGDDEDGATTSGRPAQPRPCPARTRAPGRARCVGDGGPSRVLATVEALDRQTRHQSPAGSPPVDPATRETLLDTVARRTGGCGPVTVGLSSRGAASAGQGARRHDRGDRLLVPAGRRHPAADAHGPDQARLARGRAPAGDRRRRRGHQPRLARRPAHVRALPLRQRPAAAVPRKEVLFRVFFVGPVLRGAKQIPVYRESADASQAFSAAVAAVRDGECVAIYPEATLTRDPDLWPMVGKTGAARVALETGAPVIPVAQWGPQELLRAVRQAAAPVPAQDDARLGRAAGRPRRRSRAARSTAALLREVTERIMAAITELLEEIRGEQAPRRRFDLRQHRAARPAPGSTADDRTRRRASHDASRRARARGSWGTAFAMVLADAGTDVVIWGRRAGAGRGDHPHATRTPTTCRASRCRSRSPATARPGEALAGAEVVVLAVPSQTLRANLERLGAAAARRTACWSA